MNEQNDRIGTFSDDFSMASFDAARPSHPDKCTQCGICLNACPTYQVTQDFNQSPMGRIKILRQSEIDDEQKAALGTCLHCLACETACPSGVDYRNIIDHAYKDLSLFDRQSAIIKWLCNYVEHALDSKFTKAVIKIAAKLSIALSGLLSEPYRQMHRQIATAPLKAATTPRSQEKGIVLFAGCMGDLLQADIIDDAVHLLTPLSDQIHVESTLCCGALHRHSGGFEHSNKIAHDNLHELGSNDIHHIISIATACQDSLSSYPQWLKDDRTESDVAHNFANKICDIITYLYDSGWQAQTSKPPYRKILVHQPCSADDENHKALLSVLNSVHDIEVVELRQTYRCCGAAGTHFISHPDMASQLVAPIVDDVQSIQPDVLISSNTSCLVHIEAALRAHSLNITVLHPVSLLRKLA